MQLIQDSKSVSLFTERKIIWYSERGGVLFLHVLNYFSHECTLDLSLRHGPILYYVLFENVINMNYKTDHAPIFNFIKDRNKKFSTKLTNPWEFFYIQEKG